MMSLCINTSTPVQSNKQVFKLKCIDEGSLATDMCIFE